MKSKIAPVFLLIAVSAFAADRQVHRDLGYVEPKNERQSLDVYTPAEGKNHPIVVWIHGGGWQKGSKTEMHLKPRGFVEHGCVFVPINYRFISVVTIKEMAGDVAKAIRWIHQNATQYGGDPNSIFVMGHSAGAQLAALVCTDERYLKAEGLPLTIIKGCVPVDGDSYYPALQIETLEAVGAKSDRSTFGDAASQKELSSVLHVGRGKGIPRFLLLHIGGRPESGTAIQAQILAKALEESRIAVRILSAEGKTHSTLNEDLGRTDDKPTQAVFEFIDAQMHSFP